MGKNKVRRGHHSTTCVTAACPRGNVKFSSKETKRKPWSLRFWVQVFLQRAKSQALAPKILGSSFFQRAKSQALVVKILGSSFPPKSQIAWSLRFGVQVCLQRANRKPWSRRLWVQVFLQKAKSQALVPKILGSRFPEPDRKPWSLRIGFQVFLQRAKSQALAPKILGSSFLPI